MTAPKSLIISSPFERPTHHWRRASDSRLDLIEGRRLQGLLEELLRLAKLESRA